MSDFDRNKRGKEAGNFARFTGVAFQMLATIGIMTFIGFKIDENRENKQLIFTAIFGFIGVVISLVQVVRSLNKNN